MEYLHVKHTEKNFHQPFRSRRRLFIFLYFLFFSRSREKLLMSLFESKQLLDAFSIRNLVDPFSPPRRETVSEQQTSHAKR